jgi:hypothetical protein
MNRVRALNRVGLLMRNIGHGALYVLGKRVPVTLTYLKDIVVIGLKHDVWLFLCCLRYTICKNMLIIVKVVW